MRTAGVQAGDISRQVGQLKISMRLESVTMADLRGVDKERHEQV
jgi:hypothetical protein